MGYNARDYECKQTCQSLVNDNELREERLCHGNICQESMGVPKNQNKPASMMRTMMCFRGLCDPDHNYLVGLKFGGTCANRIRTDTSPVEMEHERAQTKRLILGKLHCK